MVSRFSIGALGRCVILTLALFLGSLWPAHLPAADSPKAPAKVAKDLFGLTTLWTIHLEISAKEFEAMQPPVPAFGGLGPPPKTKPSTRDSERNLFGTEFPWANGEMTANGK